MILSAFLLIKRTIHYQKVSRNFVKYGHLCMKRIRSPRKELEIKLNYFEVFSVAFNGLQRESCVNIFNNKSRHTLDANIR